MAWDRVGRAARAAWVAAGAGLVAAFTTALFVAVGQPWGTVNDTVLLGMTLAIAPMMLGSYELGGVTPLWPARVSLAGGIGAVLVWSGLQAAFLLGAVSFDYDRPATGALFGQCLALIVIGAWLTGAPLLAGPWLPGRLRVLGALAGLGFVLLGAGLILYGLSQPLPWIGGFGYQVLFPLWAALMARVFSSRARPAR